MHTLQGVFVSYWSVAEFLLLLAASVALLAPLTPSAVKRRSVVIISSVLSVFLGIAFIIQIISYFYVPNYFDYAEPMMVVLATNFLNGAPVYQDSVGGHVVGSLYGPLSFLIHAPLLWFSPTIMSSKVVGAFEGVISIALIWIITGLSLPTLTRLSLVGLYVAVISLYGVAGFWNRPDPALILFVCLGLILLLRTNNVITIVGVAILCGLAANLKPHGWLYVFPIAMPALMRLREVRARVVAFACGAIIGTAVFLLPYAYSNISLSTYVENLLTVRKHGLSLSLFLHSAAMACTLVWIPAAWVWRSADPADRLLAFGAMVASIFVAVASSKPGGGSYHMMPFAPLTVHLLSAALSRTRTQQAAVRVSTLALCSILVTSPVFVFNWWKTFRLFPDRADELAQGREAADFFAAFPGAEMGVGATTNGNRQKLRVFAGLTNNTVLFDIVNWQDLRLAGEPVSLIYPLLNDCRVPAWVMPKGEPEFSAVAYPGIPMFDETFRASFRAHYAPEVSGRYYIVWTCKRDRASDKTR